MFPKGALLLLFGLLLMLTSTLGRNFTEQDSFEWTLTEADNNDTVDCMGEDYLKCYENVLDYVTLGEEAIELSEEKKAVIVIGLTRVGKSTFTQFVANQTNPLVVSCEGTSCQLIDDSGDGGDSVISKTFVPNTVEDVTNGVITPFYDMPGFDDTRNTPVEIANSFFIKKVVENIEGIKIVVVVNHAGFKSGSPPSFIDLMKILVKFARNPAKFKGSIVLISNMGSYHGDAAHFFDIKKYLTEYKESLYKDNSPHPPSDRATATSWIDCFLDAPEENPEDLQKVAIFRTPEDDMHNQSVRDIPKYQTALARMKQIIWDESVFTTLSENDVGFTLSIEAESFLDKASRESSTNITNELTGFGNRIGIYLQGLVSNFSVGPTDEDLANLEEHIGRLQNMIFEDCNLHVNSSPRACIDQIEFQTSNLVAEINDFIFTDINKTTNFLQFVFKDVGKEKPYDMEEWVAGLNGMWPDLLRSLDRATIKSSTAIKTELTNFTSRIVIYIHGLIRSLIERPTEEDFANLETQLSTLQNLKFEDCNSDPTSSPRACIDQIHFQMSNLTAEMNDSVFTNIDTTTNFLQFVFADVIKEKQYTMDEWVVGLNGVWPDLFRLLVDTESILAQNVISELKLFSDNAHVYFTETFEELTNEPIPVHVDLHSFNLTVGELLQLQFLTCSGPTQNSPSACINEIIRLTSKIDEMTDGNLANKLVYLGTFLEFLNSKLEFSTKLDTWVEALDNLKSKVDDSLEASFVPDRIYNMTLNQLTGLAQQISSYLLKDIESSVHIQDLTSYLKTTETVLTDLSVLLNLYPSKDSLAGYIELILSVYAGLSDYEVDKVRLDVIYMIEQLKVFPWYSQSWTNFHQEHLVSPVSSKSTAFQFLEQLHTDLETPHIQVNQSGSLHSWRKDNPYVDMQHFDAFWGKFTEANVNAVLKFYQNKDKIYLHISTQNYYRDLLNTLLDYTLKRDESCPSVEQRSVTFTRNYMTLSYVVNCLATYTTKPEKVIALAENTFFFDGGLAHGSLSNKSKVFIMSQNFDLTRVQEMDFSGKEGLPPDSKPVTPGIPSTIGIAGAKGNTGDNGSDFIALFLTQEGSFQNARIDCKGGNGGNGQDGGDGSDSSSTRGPWQNYYEDEFLPDTSNGCHAWGRSGGEIQINKYPNTCNNPGGTCAADYIRNVCGDKPSQPGSYGRGGTEGIGGIGGVKVMLNVTDKAPTVEQFPDGIKGTSGVNGNSGKFGTWGATEVRADDVERGAGKQCKIREIYKSKICYQSISLHNISRDSSPYSEFNLKNLNGIEKHVQAIQIAYSLSEFKVYINQLVTSANGALNIFNRKEMTIFLKYVVDNSKMW